MRMHIFEKQEQLIELLYAYNHTKSLPEKSQAKQNVIDDLKQLSIYVKNYDTIRKLLETLSLNTSNIESKTVRSGDQSIEEKPMVLSTIHRAKGLEWRAILSLCYVKISFLHIEL